MIQSPPALFLSLLLLVGALVWFFQTPYGRRLSAYVPVPFWMYFIPILFSTAGIFPRTSPVYDSISVSVLPAALILLLVGTPVTSLLKLGLPAGSAVVVSALSMGVGTVMSFLIYAHWLPPESHKMAGAMLATWVGGSANLVAAKEILSISDAGMAPLILVDTFLSYGWMALLIYAAVWQRRFDRWAQTGSDLSGSPLVPDADLTAGKTGFEGWRLLMAAVTIGLAFFLGGLIMILGTRLATLWSALTPRAWTVLLASLAGICLAMTPLKKLESWGASTWGTRLLYLVLATIGVKTSLHAAATAPIFLLFGGTILLIHGVLLVLFGKIRRIPLFLLATASQAGVGGPVSAPIVAGVYRPGSASLGVLMALFGATIGTYIGLFGAWICGFLETAVRGS